MLRHAICGALALLCLDAHGDDEIIHGTSKCHEQDWEGVSQLQATVTSNADGDTVRVRTGSSEYSVRMLSIDTPEKNYEQQNQGYWAFRASERLAKLLPPGTRVKLEFEKVRCDTYGRMLAHVWKGKTNVNLRMVRDGYAVNYCIYPNIAHCAQYGREAQRNWANETGLFSDPDLIIPYEWRRIVSGREPEKFVGDISDHWVYAPDQMDLVDIGRRVFFIEEEDIAPPFELAP